ncbi:MAG: transposase [Chitinophagaceae bacterium]|nr:MAG: transposase [Chitinophagaceae bacterium]
MPNKYQNKYRIPSARLKNWDYTSNGAYFITICTKNRKHYFGEISNGEMQLSPIGELAQQFWKEIPLHFPSVELGNFAVMPNHMHGILIISTVQTLHCNVSNISNNDKKTLHCNVSTDPNPDPDDSKKNPIPSPKPGSISTIIRSYKSVVTKNAHYSNKEFQWHSRFHDHIIRNSESFERIQNYIADNPANWGKDKFSKRK